MLARAGLILALMTGLAVLYTHDPAQSRFYPVCPMHSLTGLFCPGCGTSRAVHRLLHGDLWTAWRMNPLLLLSLPFLIHGAWSVYLRRERGPAWATSSRAGWAIFWGLLFFTVARNIPMAPFTALAPP